MCAAIVAVAQPPRDVLDATSCFLATPALRFNVEGVRHAGAYR
jgi:hypothetical protein